MKVTCYINLHWQNKTWKKPGGALCDIYHKNRTVRIEWKSYWGARWKVKKKLKTRFACIGTVAFARKVNVTMFILMKTVIFICRGRHEGITNVKTYRDRQGQTRTDRDRQGQTGTDRDRQGQAGTSMDRQGQVGTSRDRKGMCLLVPTCPCSSLPCPCLSLLVPALSLLFLLVPALSLAMAGLIGK